MYNIDDLVEKRRIFKIADKVKAYKRYTDIWRDINRCRVLTNILKLL